MKNSARDHSATLQTFEPKLETAENSISRDDQIDMWQGPEEHYQDEHLQVKAADRHSDSDGEKEGACVVSRRSIALKSRGMTPKTVENEQLKLGQ